MTASIRGGIFTMAMLLKGAEVAKALTEELHAKTEELKKNGVEPCLAILRVGAREDDLAYERGALKRCEKVGVAVRQVVLPEDVTQEVLMENIHALGADEKVHGVLMFRPLPGHLDDEAARAALEAAPGVEVMDDTANKVYPMPGLLAGTDGTFVGRLRKDPTVPHGIAFWDVADQIRKGAALNAVQIAQLLLP